ncbi:transporter substrate-binding domain-containing protein [Pseudodesulfovibrio cashew]|nr:transporter substrate-binding domain-containing protein [Pseudodesulfovibrio cashew]
MLRSLFLILLMTLVAAPAPARGQDRLVGRETCVFGMPYLGHAVMPGRTGLLTDILKEVFEGAHVDLDHRPMPYARALEAVKSGGVDCALDVRADGGGALPARVPLISYDLAAAYRRCTPFKDATSLAGQKVAYLNGFGLVRFLPVEVDPLLVYDLSSAYHLLDRGEVAFILGDSLLLKRAMDDSRLPIAPFVISPIRSLTVRPVFSPDKRGRRLRDLYDRRMRELLASGALLELLRQKGYDEAAIAKVVKVNRELLPK